MSNYSGTNIPSADEAIGGNDPITMELTAPPSYGPLHPIAIWSRLKHDVAALIGLGIVSIIILIALFAPVIAPQDPKLTNRDNSNAPPSWLNKSEDSSGGEAKYSLFGTDLRGQDVFSRSVYGARTSLMVGAAVMCLAALIGVTLGCIAGYMGGFMDGLIMRCVDILLAFPFLILALAMVSVVPQATLFHIALILGLTSWPGICRLMRGQVLSAKEHDFVKAAAALGAGHGAILFRHVLPNCIAPVIIWFTMGIAGAIMGEASLSFLGLGDPDSMSWGSMINSGLTRSNFPDEWWAAIFPAIFLAITVLGFNLLGDGLQDAINPRLKK